jgi:hypothetical protein
VGTVNVGFRAPVYPSFIVALRERGVHYHTRQAPPDQGADRISFPDPEITFLTKFRVCTFIVVFVQQITVFHRLLKR